MVNSVDFIQLRLLELYLQRIGLDLKRAVNVKETTQANENAREIIKIVENFVAENHQLSEQLVTSTISLLDHMSAFDTPTVSLHTNSDQIDLNSFGIINDELAETGFLGLNILANCMASSDLEICAQSAAKLNAVVHSRTAKSSEEACYFISSVERAMSLHDAHYAYLLPVLKSLVDKYYAQLGMHVQVPNIPLSKASDTFYDDFKEYCDCDEWRVFLSKQVGPMREQYLAMTLAPCQMNQKIWWSGCGEMLMVGVHKRNRALGEAKIKFEVS